MNSREEEKEHNVVLEDPSFFHEIISLNDDFKIFFLSWISSFGWIPRLGLALGLDFRLIVWTWLFVYTSQEKFQLELSFFFNSSSFFHRQQRVHAKSWCYCLWTGVLNIWDQVCLLSSPNGFIFWRISLGIRPPWYIRPCLEKRHLKIISFLKWYLGF